MKNLKELIEAATGENGLDIETLEKSINSDYVNPILAKKIETHQEEFTNKARASIESEIFTGIGIENVKDQKSFDIYSKQLTGNIDETKQSLIQAQSLNTEWEEKNNLLNSEVNQYKQALILKADITNDANYAKFLVGEYSNQVNADNDFMSIVQQNTPTTEEKPVLKAGIHQKEKDTPITIDDSEKARFRKLAGL